MAAYVESHRWGLRGTFEDDRSTWIFRVARMLFTNTVSELSYTEEHPNSDADRGQKCHAAEESCHDGEYPCWLPVAP